MWLTVWALEFEFRGERIDTARSDPAPDLKLVTQPKNLNPICLPLSLLLSVSLSLSLPTKASTNVHYTRALRKPNTPKTRSSGSPPKSQSISHSRNPTNHLEVDTRRTKSLVPSSCTASSASYSARHSLRKRRFATKGNYRWGV